MALTSTPYRPYTLSPYDRGYVIEDVWPMVYFGEETVPEIQRKAGSLPWASEALRLMMEEAGEVMKSSPLLPMEPVGWRHDFYSRSTAEHLLYEISSPDRYLDPSTGVYERDDAQRRAWALLTHERTFRIMRSLGILYRITGDERYAAWVAQGMRLAVEYFGHKEFITGETVRALYFQPLYDAAVLSMLANSYGLTRSSEAYSTKDHEDIRYRIFEERIPDQLGFLEKYPTHNMSCYVSAALALSGELLDKQEWLDAALGESSGLKMQLTKGVPEDEQGRFDGFWFEGTMFYHLYSLCPLITLWEAEKRIKGKTDPMLEKKLAEMFAAPASLVDPQLRLPAVGDLGAPRVMNLAAYRHLYEYAAGRLDEARFGPILSAIYSTSGASRLELTALAFGPDELPADAHIPDKCTLLPVAGMGVFRGPAPASIYCLFRNGKFIPGHDHPERLGISLHAFGEPISPDMGDAGYSLHQKLHRYFRSTVAHNTLFADEKEQIGDSILEWRPCQEPARARGVIDGADGIKYQRTVFFEDSYLVLLDEYSSDTDHRYGWIYHAYGDMTADTAQVSRVDLQMPPLPAEGSYSLLTDRKTLNCEGLLRADWLTPGKTRVQALVVSDGPYEATACTAPGQPLPDKLGCLLLRAPGTSRKFASVIELYKEKALVESVTLDQDRVLVKLADGNSKVYCW